MVSQGRRKANSQGQWGSLGSWQHLESLTQTHSGAPISRCVVLHLQCPTVRVGGEKGHPGGAVLGGHKRGVGPGASGGNVCGL